MLVHVVYGPKYKVSLVAGFMKHVVKVGFFQSVQFHCDALCFCSVVQRLQARYFVNFGTVVPKVSGP